ncbi:MAG: hypothetical protein WA971_04740 [Microbacterium sp.]
MKETAGRTAPKRGPRRTTFWAGAGLGGLLVGGAAVAALVVGSVVAPPVAPVAVADVKAAKVLNEAADAALASTSVVPADGQFLRIVDTRDYLVTDSVVRGEKVTKNAFRYQETDVLYVPADRSQDWVYDFSTPTKLTDWWGDDALGFEESVMAGYDYRETGIVRMPAGSRDGENPYFPYADSYDEMPRDPQGLLDWFQQDTGLGAEYAAKHILDALAMNLPPADLRAALLQALALIPGFTVMAQEGGHTTLSRTYQDVEGRHLSQQFVIDTDTGMILSFTDLGQEEPGSVVPSGEPYLVETFSITVVDTAP